MSVSSAELLSPNAPHTVNFSVDVSDSDGDALTYLWSFGDGTDFDGDAVGDTVVSGDVSPSYTYTSRSIYRVD